MIYLIGGSARAGKSLLAKKLGQKLLIPYLTIDDLRPVIMAYFKGNEKQANFPFERMFDVKKIDEYYQKYSSQEIFQADLKEIKAMWPGVKALINHLLACKVDYVLDGIYLLPSLVKCYENSKNVKIIYLVKTDEEKIYEGLFKNTNNHDWLLGNTKNKETIRLAAKSVSDYGKFFSREADKYGFEHINTEDDFLKKQRRAIEYLVK